MSQKIRIGIVGATGYTGVELLRLLATHPQAEVKVITSRAETGQRIGKIFPNLRGVYDLTFSDAIDENLYDCDVAFFATPHGVAMKSAKNMIDRNIKVIDLAADFRLQNLDEFEKWYQVKHECPELLSSAAYGLTELNRKDIAQAMVVANPGCYPTTIQLGFFPLLSQKLIDAGSLIADCKSGVSGAGRKAELGTLFSESSDNMRAYGVTGHRHLPETVAQLQKFSDQKVALSFTPHLIPMIRGMYSTLYARLNQKGMGMSEAHIHELFTQTYQDDMFVDVLPLGQWPETRSTRGSNMLRMAIHQQNDLVRVMVVQDNLVKGAAGQAVQNMNVMFGLPEHYGLQHVAILP